MCFSATASFVAAGVLCVIGIIAVCFSKTTGYRLLACTPLLFAIQQFSEGVAWITYSKTNMTFPNYLSTHVFLMFAFLVWPLWIPSVLLLTETRNIQRKLLWCLIILAILLDAYNLLLLAKYQTGVTVFDHHIRYGITQLINFPHNIYLTIYACTTILPFFVSSLKLSNLFGLLILASLLFTYFFMVQAFTSVWCFFAAVLSILTLIMIKVNQSKCTIRQ